MNNYFVILGAGKGRRFSQNKPKQYFNLNGKLLIEHSIDKALDSKLFKKIIVVISKKHKRLVSKYKGRQIHFVIGGKERKDSSLNALKKIRKYKPNNVLIHDAARPFVEKGLITKSLDQLKTNVAVCPGLPLADTIASVSNNKVSKIIDREKVYRLQTPQSFNFKILSKCHNMIDESVTDDISIVLHFGYVPKIIKGSDKNMKITYKSDLKIIKSLI